MSNPDKICFLPQPGDTYSFSHSVAINDKYLVISDLAANRVVVYTKDVQGQWFRDREIYPPEDSIPYQRGQGFGINLILGENALIVTHRSTNKAKMKTDPNIPGSIFQGQYLIQLDQPDSIPVELPDTIPVKLPTDEKEDFTSFYVLLEDKPKLITISNNNENCFSNLIYFLGNFAFSKNLLLVGLPSHRVNSPNSGKGWLFNLHALDSEAIELSSHNAFIGDTVAISEQFAVVGNKRKRRRWHKRTSSPKTLIRSLKNGCTVVIDDWGRLGLDGNILSVFLDSDQSDDRRTCILKIFRLDEDATPHLIQERKYNEMQERKYNESSDDQLIGAWIQNGWLITIFKFGLIGRYVRPTKFCLESVEQIISNSIN